MTNNKLQFICSHNQRIRKHLWLKFIFTIITTLILVISLSQPSIACPHYDEYDDEYFWLYDADDYPFLLYFNDHYDRFVNLDNEYNVKNVEFIIPLIHGSEINQFEKFQIMNVGNRIFGFDLPIKELDPRENGDNIFNLTYNFKVIPLNTNLHGNQLSRLESTLKTAGFIAFEERVLDIKPNVKYIYKDDTPDKVSEINSFSQPIKISYDLSPLSLTQNELDNLTGVYFEPIAQGNYKIVKIKGNYDKQKGIYSFTTNKTGLHSVITIDTTPRNDAPQKDNNKDQGESNESSPPEPSSDSNLGSINDSEIDGIKDSNTDNPQDNINSPDNNTTVQIGDITPGSENDTDSINEPSLKAISNEMRMIYTVGTSFITFIIMLLLFYIFKRKPHGKTSK